MYKTGDEAVGFVKELAAKVSQPSYIAVPFTAIAAASHAAADTSVTIGAQNMHDAAEGAYTGEISAKMLKSAGAKFVILGHSERRHLFHETNEFINHKVKMALKEQIQPILCIGETLEEYEAGTTKKILKEQLEMSLAGIKPDKMKPLVLAYEPVWAIGTGKTATPEIAKEMHAYIRQLVKEKWGIDVPILYGGSVKPENARALMAQKDIDGVLVGGASLNVDSFTKIIQN